MNVLLLQLEFSRWKTARPWTYSANFGIAQALRNADIETFTIPVIPDQNLEPQSSWVSRAQTLLQGKTFDQVWVWLLHYPYEQETLEWIRHLAPIRIGFLGESMQYDEEDYVREPILRKRPSIIRQQVEPLTHVLVGDENDVEAIASWNDGQVMWWPGCVPQRFITPFQTLMKYPRAVFHGTLYGNRHSYFLHHRLKNLLTFPTSNEYQSEFQQLFDDVQVQMEQSLRTRPSLHAGEEFCRDVKMLDQVRSGEFRAWMQHLREWGILVNLPSYAKFYGGRVFEGLAAGRPVISWDIPDHPQNRALFQDGEEILLFAKDDYDGLANHIDSLLSDSKYASRLVSNAQRKLHQFHTIEKRVRDVLQWVERGIQPCYEARSDAQAFSLDTLDGWHDPEKNLSMVEHLPGESSIEPLPERDALARSDGNGLVRSSRNMEGLVEMSREQLGQRNQEDLFYTDLFVRSGTWSTPTPNTDESMRWQKIKRFLPEIIQRFQQATYEPVRILDVGCGRGWLTNLLADYGYCEGIEPVEPVVEYGRRLFPNLTLHVGFPEALLTRDDFQPYDLIVTSEVIEHVPDGQKSHFVRTLQQLLKPSGVVILTTPRKEVWEQWRNVSPPNQPIEDWITENDLFSLFQNLGFHELGRERIYFDLPSFQYVGTSPIDATLPSSNIIALYQIWAFGFGPLFQGRSDYESWLHDNAMSQQTPLVPNGLMSTDEIPSATSTVQTEHVSSKSENPLVSVIVPTFNRRSTLKVALESIIQQTFTDYEIIVINDAGVDIEDIVASCNTRNNVTSIRHGKNRGLAAARNSGIGVARGKYLAYLDDDDRFLPRHLQTLVSYLEKSSCRAAYSDAWRVWQLKEGESYVEKKRDVPYSQDFNPDLLLLSNYFPVLCMMHEKTCLDKSGLFDETLTTHEDWDLWIRLSRSFSFSHVREITAEFTWRMDGSSMTSEIPEDYLRTKKIIYQKYHQWFETSPHLIPFREQELKELASRLEKQSFDCSIIIPVCNKVELTRQCLSHLSHVTQGSSYEVVVVDNGSTDGTQDFLALLEGDIQVLRNESNLGFAKACNQGARVAKGQYLVFLNNDTIPLPGWLEQLVEEVKTYHDVAVVGSQLLYPNDTIQHAGVVISKYGHTPYNIYRNFPKDSSAVNRRKELQAVTGACLLIRQEVFQQVGEFDEGYINGFEDVDLCLKVREYGLKVVLQPRSCLMHLEGQTPGRNTHEEFNANRFLARWKHLWLEDEDLVACQDGFCLEKFESESQVRVRYKPLNVEEQKKWKNPVELQGLLHGKVKKPLREMDEGPRIHELLTAVESWPSDLVFLEWAGRVCEDLGCEPEALRFWKKLLTISDHPNAHLGLARAAIKSQNMEEAQQHLNVLHEECSSKVEVWMLQGVLFIQQQQFAEAKTAFDKALGIDNTHLPTRMGLGMASMGLGQSTQAWSIFERVVSEYPDNVDAVRCLLQVGTTLRCWEPLASQLARFVERNPTDCDIRFALAGVHFRAGHFEKAKEQVNWLRLIKPDYEGLEDLETLLPAPHSQGNLVSTR